MDEALGRAITAQKEGRLEDAITILKKSLRSGKPSANTVFFLGVLLEAQGEFVEAESYLVQATKLRSKAPEYWYVLGNVQNRNGNRLGALDSYGRCVELDSNHLRAWVNRALVAQSLERYDAAVSYSRKAVEISPDERKAWHTLLGSLGFSRKFDEAIKTNEECLKRFPDDAELYHMLGGLLRASGAQKNPTEFYQKAIELEPTNPKYLNSLGDHLSHQHRAMDAIPYHQKARELNPKLPQSAHGLATAYLKAGYPTNAVPLLIEAIQLGYPNSDAFDALLMASLYLENFPEKQVYDFHCQWEAKFAKEYYASEKPELQKSRKLRVGFVSPDFKNHSVARFVSCLIQNVPEDVDAVFYSDVKQVETHGQRLEAMGGNWVYSWEMTDEVLDKRIREDQIDVLVDLAGHTGNNRLFVFARKPAPLQISWLGYPHTTALKTVDYRFSDEVADPKGEADDFSSEKIVRLADGFHCFEPPIELPNISDLPAKRKGYLTFGSFNNQAKINPGTVRLWAMLLSRYPNSRMILKNYQLSDPRSVELWKKQFENCGIGSNQIDFVEFKKDLAEHYALYSEIDIALDTFPYNGTTTTCEALWMGVPVLSMMGETQRSRTAASLLTHAGLENWIATDENQWIQKVDYWSENLDDLEELRLGLRDQVEQSPIGDGSSFAQKFFGEIVELVREEVTRSS